MFLPAEDHFKLQNSLGQENNITVTWQFLGEEEVVASWPPLGPGTL